MEIDWLKATEDQRKQLYVATRAVADAADTTVEVIIDAALGRKVLMGADYISTFRRGKIRRSYAKLIYGWILEHHLQTAQAIAADLFPLSHTDAWQELIATKAIHGQLRIARFDKSMGLVERKRSQPKPGEVLKLGEEFCFRLDSKIDGYAVAFQEYEGKMHPLPLGLNGELSMCIMAGEQFLPLDDAGRPEKLSEVSDLGLHRFIVAIANEPHKPSISMHPPDLSDNVDIYVIRVQIAP